jgi:toxin ParE1/3/4
VEHRLAPGAIDDLDEIAYHVGLEAGLATAEKLIASLTERFHLLAAYPQAGRARDADLGQGRRSVAVGSYVIIYRLDEHDVSILRVLHGRRDLEGLFRDEM